jgi:hypothetical protein
MSRRPLVAANENVLLELWHGILGAPLLDQVRDLFCNLT